MTNLFAQHMPSNTRTVTDEFLVHPSQFSYMENRETIESKKSKHEYVEVFDSEIVEIRESSNNSLTIGDATAIILAKHMKGYNGLQDVNDDESIKQNSIIVDSYYDYDASSTVYFLKAN